MNARESLTAERARELVNYNPSTGSFTWLVTRRGVRKGSVAGSIDNRGYRVVRLDGKMHQEHRLAWLWTTGEWPSRTVDHEDTDRSNNRWGNLRLATWSQNLANRGPNKNNTSGVKGVRWHRNHNKWVAGIMVDRVSIHLGYFTSIDDASSAYANAAVRYFGEFAKAA